MRGHHATLDRGEVFADVASADEVGDRRPKSARVRFVVGNHDLRSAAHGLDAIRPDPGGCQNIVLSLAAVSGTACSELQRSTILASRTRKRSTTALPRSPGVSMEWLCTATRSPPAITRIGVTLDCGNLSK